MTIEQLRLAAAKRPFRPFELRLADGQRIAVRSPEFLMIPPTAQWTFVVYREPEAYDVIDRLLVTSIRFGTAPTDGRRPRRRR